MSCIGLSAGHSNASVNWNSNLCYTETDLHFIRSNYQGDSMERKFTGKNNAWYTGIVEPTNSIVPLWDSNPIVTDPLLTIDKSKIIISSGSPLRKQSESPLLRDIYGQIRVSPSSIGAVVFMDK